MKTTKIILLYLFFCLLIGNAEASLAKMPWETPSTQELWMRGDTHTTNTILGYKLNQSKYAVAKNVTVTKSGVMQVWWAVKVFVIRTDGSLVELTTGYNVNVTRSVNGGGLQSVNWKPSLTDLFVGGDALRVAVYVKMGAMPHVLKAVFVTTRLRAKTVVNSTWTFWLYTFRGAVSNTEARFCWGSTTYQSRIKNVQFGQLAPWETMMFYMQNQNFISFVVQPWTYWIGNGFYGVLTLFGCLLTYLRYNDVRPVVVMVWIFGGAGGVLQALVPAVGLHLAWFFLAFALAVTLFLLINRQ